ncbi:OB-fold domain-containing protein [Sphingobium sp.]|uniref:OB-fold domain-containing protein n=1 Tax=Sphingobium sp. TaxID=1912891 RepID=UPI0028BE72C6|nr:OB-fold domain-containing protein [Sphingobium sp.]
MPLTDPLLGITGFGCYLPRGRMLRSAIFAANGWFAPNLKSLAKGERSFAGWDEDAVTMAVEAGRCCLGSRHGEEVGQLVFASVSAPFADRQGSGIVKEALDLPDTVSTIDMGGSIRSGLSAMIGALERRSDRATLIVASDRRKARPASEAEMTLGDGAAAILVGAHDPIATLIGHASISADFVDHFRSPGRVADYEWEARWIRDEGYGGIVRRAIEAALAQAGLSADDVDHLIVPASAAIAGFVAKACGIGPHSVVDPLTGMVGQTGSAHPLLMLNAVLGKAAAGEVILVTGFGSGCDACLLRTSDAIETRRPTASLDGWLARRIAVDHYPRFLAVGGMLEVERGMRAEIESKQPLTALYRNRRTVLGLVGTRGRETGSVQYPPSPIPLDGSAADEVQDAYRLADRPARIQSFTIDNLAYSPDPPTYYGAIEFDGGGRMTAEFCDMEPGDAVVGREMRMMFRIKSIDESRGFVRYFWKAAPGFQGQ